MPSSSRKGLTVGAVLFALVALGASLRAGRIFDMGTTRGNVVATGSLAVPRFSQTATLIANGKVLIAGGMPGNGAYHATVELYDPATGRFTPTGGMATPRYKLAVVLLTDGRALIIGGSDNLAWRGEYSSAELYDPVTGMFFPAANMNFKRYKLPTAVVRLANGRILIAGGAERAEVYDPGSGSFLPTTGSKLDGSVLIAGGYGNNPGAGGVSGAWLYQP